jgi:hypothetical protein
MYYVYSPRMVLTHPGGSWTKTYYATTYAKYGVNQIWILKNLKELLANR